MHRSPCYRLSSPAVHPLDDPLETPKGRQVAVRGSPASAVQVHQPNQYEYLLTSSDSSASLFFTQCCSSPNMSHGFKQ
jgi:hypothetical protein